MIILRILFVLFFVGVLVSGCSLLSQGESLDPISPKNLLRDFSGEIKSDGFPEGWEGLRGTEVVGEHVFFELFSETDQWEFRFDIDATNANKGLISERVVVDPGFEYIALIESRAEIGRVRFFLRFFDEDGKDIVSPNVNFNSGEWQTLTISEVAPVNAVWASVFMFAEGSAANKTFYRNPRLIKNDR